MSPICRRLLGHDRCGRAACGGAALDVLATTYGKLIVRNNAMPASALDTQFAHVRPPRSFLLVVTEPRKTELSSSGRFTATARARESGGASGEATVSSGHWVKQVRATWIKHPAYCSGSIVGSAASSPVLVRVFAQ